jgi:excinuclease UvrABC nuclease subunit
MENQTEFVFVEEDWFTPNTYDRNFKSTPNKSGVYLIIIPHYDFNNKSVQHEIVYIGSAKDLLVRYSKHELLRFLKNRNQYVRFYFKECNNYRAEEKRLIKLVQPQYNIQWL